MISIVLATYNEEKNLCRCLDAVVDFADEIIIVDGSSTDKTVDIAKSYNVKVISTTNKPNFHINKQMAMDAAKGELVLQLDADEVVDQELSQFIRQVVNGEVDQNVAAWNIARKNFFLSDFLTKGGQYPDPVIRLYRAGKARLPQKNVHEQMSVDGPVAMAKGHLLHYPYPDFSTYMKKFNTYTSFESSRLFDNLELDFTLSEALRFYLVKPVQTFFMLYIRHRGYVDKMPGFIFALMSSLHHPFTYLKAQELRK